ncbi:MAG: Unknown protein [uncultured Sulfurovum sp.]|uniref:Periplasmic protein n=1 Tax=uncultured Sulfurovum sp. TaxID=269237 RepID=A0A6S6U4K1_9BACT|nr:MAG: Unknown protein [uncultured Sulfurovum sp.]
MKKIIVLITLLLLSVATVEAGNKQALKHANPMPNLMRIAVGNAVLLNINAEQMKALKVWMKGSKPIMQGMVKELMAQEKALLLNALSTDTAIEKKADVLLTLRKKIIMMKTECRKELKRILSKEQYANIIKIYKSVQ